MTIQGVTFNNVRQMLAYIFYGKDFDPAVAFKYIIPMQSNFFNPIEKDSNDTYIQYFIEFDRRYTQDSYDDKENKTLKVASIQLRFTGKDAETWAKSMHHLTKRADIGEILWCVCGAEVLESVGEIRPALIDFFGKNGQIAFDVRIRLRYWETIELPWKQLQHVSIGPGKINT